MKFQTPPAVVVGLCGHGITICRNLYAGNVPIIAIEANPGLPGVKTRLTSNIVMVDDISGEGLIDALTSLRQKIVCPGMPVLFLTNDRMVKTVAHYWSCLNTHYRLSWAHCRDTLVCYLDKSVLEKHCSEIDILYPKTHLLESAADIEHAVDLIGFPLIVKPSRPLAQFKTYQPETVKELVELSEKYEKDLPFIIQTFIPGDDRAIYFCALYFDRGKILARFDGHKLRSRPLGHTTIAESMPHNEAVYQLARKFYNNLNFSGPVSLELKRDSRNRYWVIEPTIGRTDFWIGLCAANGVNFPLIEYCHQVNMPLPYIKQVNNAVWINEERDPFGRLWLAQLKDFRKYGRHFVYIYMDYRDPKPACRFISKILISLLKSLRRRFAKFIANLN